MKRSCTTRALAPGATRGAQRFMFSWYSPAHHGTDWRFIDARSRAQAVRKFERCFGKIGPASGVEIKTVRMER